MDNTVGDSDPLELLSDQIRGEQKDEFYVDQLRMETYKVFESVLGSRTAHRWRDEILSTAEILYYVPTLFSRGRTLGEEYGEIVSVNQVGSPVVSNWKWFLLACRGLPQYFLNKRWTSALPWYTLLIQANLALFYLLGGPKTIARRLLRLQQIPITIRQRSITRVFTILGIAMFLQVCIGMYQRLKIIRSLRNQQNVEGIQREGVLDESPRTQKSNDSVGEAAGVLSRVKMPRLSQTPNCLICMSPSKVPTITLCGHLFCWECIAIWLQAHNGCPICRSTCLVQNLLPIRHYLPS